MKKNANQFVSIGHKHFMSMDKIVTVSPYEGMAIKKIMNEAYKQNRVMDCTKGKKTRTVMLTTTGFYVLSCIESVSLVDRITDQCFDDVPIKAKKLGGVNGKMPKVRVRVNKSVSAKSKSKGVDHNIKK